MSRIKSRWGVQRKYREPRLDRHISMSLKMKSLQPLCLTNRHADVQYGLEQKLSKEAKNKPMSNGKENAKR